MADAPEPSSEDAPPKAGRPPPAWLLAVKARADSGDRPWDKAFGRWLGDFLTLPGDSGLLPAELGLLIAAGRGGGYTAPSATPAVRPGFLRFLAMGGDETAPVHEAGVEITGAQVAGDIDLRGARCVARLALMDCQIDGLLMIEDATLGVLVLDKSRIRGLLANRAVASGSVFMEQGFRSTGTLRLLGASIGGSLQAPGAAIEVGAGQDALVCTGLSVRGNVMLGSGFKANGPLWFNRAAIGGDLSLIGADIAGGVTLTTATIGGALYLTGAALAGAVDGEGARGRSLDAGSTQIGRSLFMSPMFTPARRRFTAVGGVRLSGARIGETLWASGARLDGAGQAAIDLSGAHVVGSVQFDRAWNGEDPAERFEAGGLVDLRGAAVDEGLSLIGAVVSGGLGLASAAIGGDVFCTGATLTGAVAEDGSRGWALNAGSAHVGGSVNLDQAVDKDRPAARFQASGLVYFGGATIDGDLLAPGGLFDNPAAALTLDRARIAGQISLTQLVWRLPAGPVPGARFEARGPVSLYAASIGGHLDCGGGLFAADPKAINGEILQVDGCIFLNGPDLAEAEAVAEANRTAADDRKTPALAAFQCNGQVMLRASRIGMQLNLLGGEIVNATRDPMRPGAAAYALDLGISQIGYEILLGPSKDDSRGPARVLGSLNLSGATARGLSDSLFIAADGPAADSFPATVAGPDGPLRCEARLDDFTYNRLASDAVMTLAARRAWLMRQPPRDTGSRFLSQPFDHLAAVLETMGQGGAARDIRILKEDRKTLAAPPRDKLIALALLALVAALLWTGWVWLALAAILSVMISAAATGHGARSAEWLWRRIFGLGVAYGYRPGRGLAVALVVALACGAFYQQAAAGGALARSGDKGIAGDKGPKTPFHPYVYSLDVMLPVAKLGEAEAWKPTGAGFGLTSPFAPRPVPVDAAATQKVVWLETVFGWLAGLILAAMASGLVRKGGKDG